MTSDISTTPGADTGLQIRVEDADATTALGKRLAAALVPGDVLCLSGTLGAGKSHLARAIIRTLLDDPELPVPSPSYTLANIYDWHREDAEIWHVDLYRLGDDDDLGELGLDEDLCQHLLLVEWPERWGTQPGRRVELDLKITGDESRDIGVRAVGQRWDRVMAALSS